MMEFMASAPWLLALTAGFLAQFSKFLSHLVMTRRLNFTRLFATGGMPSAHSAAVSGISGAKKTAGSRQNGAEQSAE